MPPSQTSARVQGGQAAVLALIAGYIDSYTLLNYKVYASFMSGNTTQTGLGAGQGRLAEAAHHLLPIPLFLIGVFVGTFLLLGGLRHPVPGSAGWSRPCCPPASRRLTSIRCLVGSLSSCSAWPWAS